MQSTSANCGGTVLKLCQNIRQNLFVAVKSQLYSTILQLFLCQQRMLSFRKAVLQMIQRLQLVLIYHVNELLVSLFILKHVGFLALTFCCPVTVIADKVHPALLPSACYGQKMHCQIQNILTRQCLSIVSSFT